MKYSERFKLAKARFYREAGVDTNQSTFIKEFDFISNAHYFLPGAGLYHCNEHDLTFETEFDYYNNTGNFGSLINVPDSDISENKSFKYQVYFPKDTLKTKKVTLLFHGFNEKDWDKYLVWAETICEKTQSAVILFPISFHMQRAPKFWSNNREMYKLSSQRTELFPNIANSSLSNAAISSRIHAMPQRFVWSGLQTYYDVIKLIEELKAGKIEWIAKDFELNLFGYSIGGFLAQILKLSNYKGYFSNSKVCLFCSGTTFNRYAPASKFILDSEANVAMYSYYVEHFDTILKKDKFLNHYIKQLHTEGEVFYAMLDFSKKRDFREALLKKYESYFYAITLKKDTIIPSFEIINTLNGAYRNINIKVEEIDFNREYTHENPFPNTELESNQIDEDFDFVFNKISDFLR
ncbi:MAG: hypothetical protein DI622_15840 [Chryseobacterium sp.]|nr:MAG: hypothetical protein DI622_15840 [Chryseobacterium sp.]